MPTKAHKHHSLVWHKVGGQKFAEYRYGNLWILLWPSDKARQAKVIFRYPLGLLNDPFKRLGLSHYLEHSLLLGCKMAFNQEEFKQLADENLLDYNASTSYEDLAVYGSGPAKKAELLTKLLLSSLFEPTLEVASVEKEKAVILDEARRKYNDQQIKYRMLANRLLLHPKQKELRRYTVRPLGALDTIEKITAQEVEEFHRAKVTPHQLDGMISGKIDPEKIAKVLTTFFDGLKSKETPKLNLALPKPRFTDKKVITDKSLGKENVWLTMRVPMARGLASGLWGDEEMIQTLTRKYFTGMATARLVKRLRTEERLVYGVSSGMEAYREFSWFGVMVNVAPDNLKKVEKIINEEWQMLLDNQIDEHLFNLCIQDWIFTRERELENWSALPDDAYFRMIFGQPIISLERRIAQLRKVKSGELVKYWRKIFKTSQLITVRVYYD